MVTIKGCEIPNEPHEMTVAQFDKINLLTSNPELDEIEKWIAKFVYLGVPEVEFDDMSMEQFGQCVKEWNDQPDHDMTKQLTIEIDGYNYTAKETIGAKDLGLIEKVWKGNSEDFGAQTLAILFKRDDLTRDYHYTPAHIKHKTALFKKQNSSLLIPYIGEVLKELTNTTRKLKDGLTTELESDND